MWHTTENIDPTQRIAENRHALDSILKDLPGIDFFFSCITGTKSNSNSKYSLIRPGIAYFIVHKKSKDVNEETVFKTFHDSGFLPTMSAMKNNQANKVDSMLNLLKQVVKDHNSTYAKETIAASLLHCETVAELTNQMEQIRTSNTTPCRLVICNEGCRAALVQSYQNLIDDDMVLTMTDMPATIATKTVTAEPTTNLGKSIETVSRILTKTNHGLYKGNIYRKEPLGEYSYTLMCSVESYLQALISLEDVQDELIMHLHSLQQILAHKDC